MAMMQTDSPILALVAGMVVSALFGFINGWVITVDDCCNECTQRFRADCESDKFKQAIGGKNVEVYTVDSELDIAKQTDNVETLLNKCVDVMLSSVLTQRAIPLRFRSVTTQACRST